MPAVRNVTNTKAKKGSLETLNIIIPAAIPSKRMKTLGPISTIEIGNQTVLEKQIKTIQKIYPAAQIIVVTGYMDFRVRNRFWGIFDNNVRLVYNPLYEQTHTLYSIRMALENTLPGPVMVIHGDIVFNILCIKDMLSDKKSKLLLDCGNKLDNNKVGILYKENGSVISISYGLEKKWGQISLFQNKELRILRRIAFNDELNKTLTTYETIKKIIDKNGNFSVFYSGRQRLLEIDSSRDIEKACLI